MRARYPHYARPAAFLLLASLLTACSETMQPLVNLALRKPAYHSSAIDFNATAQLAVDGILESEMPCWVEVCGNNGRPLDKISHDMPTDPRPWTAIRVEGPAAELSVRTHGFREPVNRISIFLTATLPDGVRQATYTAELFVQEKGEWQSLRTFQGKYAGARLQLDWEAPEALAPEGWRIVVEIPAATALSWQEWHFYRDGKWLPMLTAEHFSSVWVPATGGPEWLAVDLGEECRFEEVRLHWLNGPAEGTLQAGNDSVSWHDIAAIGGRGTTRSDTLHVRGRARWIRLKLDSSFDGNPYILSELELLGSSKASAHDPQAVFTPEAVGKRAELNGGWQLARYAQASDPAAWIPATVPGTVLVSYLDNGCLPDPNFGDNQQYISDSYFQVPFLYRCHFALPQGYAGGQADEHIRLHFDGINWKADVRLNGTEVGRIEGAFTDASFDITSLLKEDNLLEVKVFPPAHPGMTKSNTLERCASNGGILGADNPTFHASIGWDWIPTIRGRNMGIWNDVWLERNGAVRILNPHVTSTFSALESLPPILDTTTARITLTATLVNESTQPVETVWEGRYGEVPFRQQITIPAGQAVPVTTNLMVQNPRLWWPNGYGEPYLYDVLLRAGDSDSLQFQHGIRQLTYDMSGHNLRIWINGRRLVARGGNWGFSESNLRYRAADYETAMQLHRHENFNIVRNWVGMVGDAEFYEAADRNGILIWQDFWLANPADGPDPYDESLFMQNAENTLLRIRNHPSLLLWCGRNEGYPPASLDQALRALVAREDPGSCYISSSADDYVSGRGPYRRLASRDYYRLAEIPYMRDESIKFHSERGMPNFPNYESLVEMMPADEAWPPSRLWGIHDFALQSAQGGETFLAAVETAFGPSPDAETFAERAQWINYEGYRAIFESRSRHRRGVLLWMSHPAWPSMAFCTYDFFLDPTAAYYACRKSCEPIHIQWNPYAEQVEVVNYSAGNRTGLRAQATLYDLSGNQLGDQSVAVDAPEDSTIPCPSLQKAVDGLCFLRLHLYEGETLLSANDYLLSPQESDLRQLNSCPKAALEGAVTYDEQRQCYVVHLKNTAETPALMLHLTVRDNRGERILPVFWSDNYIHLLPGGERELTVRTGGDGKVDAIRVTGFNLNPLSLRP